LGLKSVGLGDPRHLQLEWFVLALVMQLVEAGGRGGGGEGGARMDIYACQKDGLGEASTMMVRRRGKGREEGEGGKEGGIEGSLTFSPSP